MGQRVGVVLPIRIAGVGRLDEREGGRVAVDRDRTTVMSGPSAGVGGLALEVQAEAGQALRGPVGEDDVVAGQEPVRLAVVDQVHGRVDAGVSAVAGLRVQPRPRTRQRVSAGGAAPCALDATTDAAEPSQDAATPAHIATTTILSQRTCRTPRINPTLRA